MSTLNIFKNVCYLKYSLFNRNINQTHTINYSTKMSMSSSKSTILAKKHPKVLSIQSRVVHGIVGNNCASYTLQRLGFEVDTIDTVQYSNHTGYLNFQGPKLDPNDFDQIINTLNQNKLLNDIKYILTGYTGTSELLKQMSIAIKNKIKINNEVMYLCDPVLGDNGHLYVPEECIEVYKNDIIPLADVITPNHFEAEIISNTKIVDIESCINTCDVLHDMGPSIVVS